MMMDGWISTLDALPEKGKVVLTLKNDGTDLLYLSFAKLIDTTPERWSEVDYYVLGDALEIKPDNELVLYWREADLDGLSDIIGLWLETIDK